MLKDLMSKTFAGQIEAGKHKAVITTMEFVDNAARPDYAYIKLSMLVDGRPYARNMFERDMVIFLSHTRQQLGRQYEDIQPMNYLKELITNKTALDIWFSYPTVTARDGSMKHVQNINWLEPMENNAQAPAEDMESPL